MSDSSHRHVLVDSCSLHYYRATATLSWYSRAFPDQTPSSDSDELMTSLERQYLKNMDRIIRDVGVPMHDMLLVRDCPRPDIWRMKHLPTYKSNRSDTDKPSKYGPFIKHLNTVMKSRYKSVMRVPHAEADDIIGVLTRYIKFQDPDAEIIIIANDSDYTQLMRHSNVRIYHPKSGWISCDDPIDALERKLKSGDSSDCIPASTPMHLKRLLIDMSCIPKNIQDTIITAYLDLKLDTEHRCLQYYPLPVQLGLCCMNTKLHERKIMCSRTMRLDTLEKKGIDELKRRAKLNCTDLMRHLQWNAENGIRVFRMSSDLFPHKSNPKAPDYTFDFALDLLKTAGQFARDTDQRLTFHPGQYNVVGTPREEMFHKTIADLDWHAEVLDLMGCGPDSVMVVHGGGTYGDKEATKRRWVTNFARLPERVRRRLVLENCEKSFSITDCIDVSRGWTDSAGKPQPGCGVPVVLDTHHYACYEQSHPKEQFHGLHTYIPDVLETWNKRHIKPKMHISEQNPDKQLGAHSDLISCVPQELLDIPKLYGVNIDIMVEAKLKEQAIEGLYRVHPELNPAHIPSKTPIFTPPVVKIRAKLRATDREP